ncbi:AAA family ATPase [Aggregatibacter aphrophilus]|jgi:AAA ATPase|uniref:AAA family ATPase n=1 Tax=Aggregatibacter aphrophilus TaxID=732 RepID=UPI000D650110|nr:ATP-binding protein [Aggregatibacter aphrophilus]
MKYIHNISGKIEHLDYEINIDLNGKNLILVGANGVGKTSILDSIYKSINIELEKNNSQIDSFKNTLDYYKRDIKNYTEGSNEYIDKLNSIKYYKEKLKEFNSPLTLSIPNISDFIRNFNTKKAIRSNFSAYRISRIQATSSSTSLEEEKKNSLELEYVGSTLEQHLLNIRVTKSLLMTEAKDHVKANKFSQWFDNFERQLKYLFEDNDTKLEFDVSSMKFYIIQKNKKFTFQNLSSGYQAIFDIYADLLMRTELFDITPDELTGVVLIDEIDAHLHISLQKIILPFFINSFPKVQFIVSTHSPFVISSSSNTVIYDLTTQELITNNVTYYSNDAIVKGLFHVNTTHSIELQDIIDELKEVIDSDINESNKLREYIKKLEPFKERLTNSAKVILLLAENKVLDIEENR